MTGWNLPPGLETYDLPGNEPDCTCDDDDFCPVHSPRDVPEVQDAPLEAEPEAPEWRRPWPNNGF